MWLRSGQTASGSWTRSPLRVRQPRPQPCLRLRCSGSGAPPKVRLRAVQGRGPGDRIESPYDAEARFRAKSGTKWAGYMVHLTETCDASAPHLVLHADTTPANVHEVMRMEPIHAPLTAKGLVPGEHLVDAAYVSAEYLVTARERHGIDLIDPPRPVKNWQTQRMTLFLSPTSS
jgi:hypothetical protein